MELPSRPGQKDGLKDRPASQVGLIGAKLELPLELSGEGGAFSSGADETIAGSRQARPWEKDEGSGERRKGWVDVDSGAAVLSAGFPS